MLDAGNIEWLAGVIIIGFQLGFGSIGDRSMFVQWVLQFGGVWVSKSDLDFVDVTVHCEATGALGAVPFTIDTCKFSPLPISSDFVVFLKDREEVLSMLEACVLDCKAINNQYRLPFVSS